MALEISVKPTISNNGNGMPTTDLNIAVDVTSILDLLKKYDLLLKTKITVYAKNVITQEYETYVYEFAKVYKNVTEALITFTTIVWGYITDTKDIICTAEGVFVNKS